MDFISKLNRAAKTVSNKTNDMIEVGRLTSRIHSEEDAIENHKLDLGEHIWGKFQTGVSMDERATLICMAIQEREGNIQQMKSEIEQIKQAPRRPVYEAPAPEASAPTSFATTPLSAPVAAPSMVACPTCGRMVAADAKFCGDCGTKLQ
ncbi:MAG: zinc ribbon domain-containing protein [Christensenellaceae bacterium]|jgi:hypothetical protein|nr:zinc ribbon domain-containing protein [Christensenellaceae bacterium]